MNGLTKSRIAQQAILALRVLRPELLPRRQQLGVYFSALIEHIQDLRKECGHA
jgi:hypothetical protein